LGIAQNGKTTHFFRFQTFSTLKYMWIPPHKVQNFLSKKAIGNLLKNKKTFRLNAKGEVVEVVFVHSLRTWFFDVEPEKVPKIYEAIKVFLDYCYKPENLLKTKLETGNFRKTYIETIL
jgi:hypothetical protein